MNYVVVLLLLLSACAPMQFENVSAKNTLAQDKYDCEVELGIRGNQGVGRPGQRMADLIVSGRSDMQACLERRGWKRVDG